MLGFWVNPNLSTCFCFNLLDQVNDLGQGWNLQSIVVVFAATDGRNSLDSIELLDLGQCKVFGKPPTFQHTIEILHDQSAGKLWTLVDISAGVCGIDNWLTTAIAQEGATGIKLHHRQHGFVACNQSIIFGND